MLCFCLGVRLGVGFEGGLLLVFRFFVLLASSEGGAGGGSMVSVGGVSWMGAVGLVCSLVYILPAGGAFVISFVWCQGSGRAPLCSLGMSHGFSLSCVIFMGWSGFPGSIYGLSGSLMCGMCS